MTGVLVVAPEVPRGRLAAAGWIAGRAPRKTDREGCFSMGYLPPSKLPRSYLLAPERKNAFDFHRSSGRGVGAARACRVPLDRIARTIEFISLRTDWTENVFLQNNDRNSCNVVRKTLPINLFTSLDQSITFMSLCPSRLNRLRRSRILCRRRVSSLAFGPTSCVGEAKGRRFVETTRVEFAPASEAALRQSFAASLFRRWCNAYSVEEAFKVDHSWDHKLNFMFRSIDVGLQI